MRSVRLDEIMVKVSVEELKKTLEKNRTQHEKEYEEAVKGYLNICLVRLDDEIRLVNKMEEDRDCLDAIRISMSPPLKNTQEYDTVIKMLEWSEEETIDLTSLEFRKLVEDEWDWKPSFNAAYEIYTN